MFYCFTVAIGLPCDASDYSEDKRSECKTRWLSSEVFLLLRLKPLGQRNLPIVISLSRMLCFGQVCTSPCALNVSAALQGAYITPFPTEVVRAIRAQQDEAYVSKIVCYLHVMASNRILHHDVPRISTIFILLRLNLLGQKKLSIVISLSRMLCFGRVCASACALNVSAALHGAYKVTVRARSEILAIWAALKQMSENQNDGNVRCLTAIYENKKFQHSTFLLSTLAAHLTELSIVFQAGCFNLAQMNARYSSQ